MLGVLRGGGGGVLGGVTDDGVLGGVTPLPFTLLSPTHTHTQEAHLM